MLVCIFWCIFFFSRALTEHRDLRAKWTICLFFAIASVLYLGHWLYFSDQHYMAGEWAYAVTNLCVYPLYYVYLRALTRSKPTWEFAVLFAPALVVLVLFPFARDPESQLAPFLHIFSRLCFAMQVLYVLIRGYRFLRAAQQRMDDAYTDDRSRLLKPTHVMLQLFGLTAIVSSVLNLIGREFFVAAEGDVVILPACIMSALLYGLGYVAAQTAMPQDSIKDEPAQTEGTPLPDALMEQIDEIMKVDCLYRRQDLTIQDVAQALSTNRSYVSLAINTAHGVNFSTYVNRFRVKEAKRILVSDGYERDKVALLDALALSGFATEQTFYRVFKEMTGMTPLQYRHKHVRY